MFNDFMIMFEPHFTTVEMGLGHKPCYIISIQLFFEDPLVPWYSKLSVSEFLNRSYEKVNLKQFYCK